ncbi:MAG: RNB domain-containing ribonuclease, partial [Lentisphaeria bacterium]|nr:RNB domain-containing ribonuclease [Lentisphaeria bacterium]
MIIFKQGNLLAYHGKPAILQSVSDNKLEIRIEGGSSKSVRPKDIEWIHNGPCSNYPELLPMPEPMEEYLELIGEEKLSFAEFCELLYSANTAAAAWSGYKLLKDGLYFTGSPEEGVIARPAVEIKAALDAVQAKENAKKQYQALLERIRQKAILPEDRSAMCEIEEFALGRIPSCRILKDLEIEAIPEKAHALLIRLGVWSDLVNPFPVRAGIDMQPPDFELPSLPEEAREDLTGMVSLAIDNAASNDPDDAIGYDAENGLLWVHVADPSVVIEQDSEADLFASRAGENLYLPDQVIPILPPEATERFGLGLQEISPALSFGIHIDTDGVPTLEKICASNVRVERLTYEDARLRMDESHLKEIAPLLERFKEYRRKNGALFIRMPEVHIAVRDNDIHIEPLEITPERELVANAMLAAGAAVADFAVKNEIPMPFAAQDPVDEEVSAGETLSAMYQLRRACTPGYISVTAEPHAGLGLSAYVRVTSPLRRYTDLLAHRQLRRYLAGEELMDSETLENYFIPAEKESVIRRKAERTSNEYYTLVWLARNSEWSGEACVVNRINDSTTLLIRELAYEFKSRGCTHSQMEEILPLKLNTVDPPKLLSRFS